jgi:hypothetical protein
MTGGLDSRLVFASFLAAGAKPQLYYGTGDTFITNTFKEDKDINIAFANKFGLSFHDADWSTPEPMDKYWDKYLDLYGFYYQTYGASDKFMESTMYDSMKLFTLGYSGELLRTPSWIEGRGRDFFTLDEYLNEFYITLAERIEIVDIDEYIPFIRSKLLRICDYYHLDINHIANEDFFYLTLEKRKHGSSVVLNQVNLMKYCSYTLVEYEHLLAGRVTCEEADNSRFMLHCLYSMKPEVLDVPVFSRCRMREFYPETMSLNSQITPLTTCEKIKKNLKIIFPWLVRVRVKIFGVRRLWRSPKDENVYQYVFAICNQLDHYNLFYKDKINDARRTLRYIMTEYAIEKAMKKS